MSSASRIVVLCGGRGRRLGKLTDDLPKPLIRIRNRTILEMKYDNYYGQGYRDFIFCTGYRSAQIMEEVTRFRRAGEIFFSDSGEAAGMLQRITNAAPYFSERVIITYGDTFTDIDLQQLEEAHIASGNEATIVVAPIQNPFGLVEFDSRNKVTSFREKPTLNYYIGYAVLNRSALDFALPRLVAAPDGAGLVAFFKVLMGLDELGVFYHSGLQITFNTEDELRAAQKSIVHFYTTEQETE